MNHEEEYLAYVEQCLNRAIEKLNIELDEGARDVESMHDYYWENYTEMDEYGYENYDNRQMLLQAVDANNRGYDLKRRYRRMQDNPYFGRVDFCYDGEDESESHYIGIANFSPETGGMPLVFDWRAPVSGLFYDFDKGPGWYDAPEGRIEGEITAKGQYKIRHGQLIYAVDSDIKVDDDILQEELSGNGSVNLKNIVRTIQKEQNAIIRNTKDSILVVQGAAGSGKSSIAMHRIAYLLYHDRGSLTSKDVLILSPNQVFSSYISTILPELGEENISEMSFDFFAWKELRSYIPDAEDFYDQLERELRPGTKAKMDVYLKKSSKAFAEEIYGYCLELESDIVNFEDLNFKKISKTARELEELFYEKFPDLPLLTRMDAVRDYVIDEAETLAGKDFNEDQKVILAERFERMYVTKDLYVIYSRFLAKQGMRGLPHASFDDRKLRYEDLYPMLYMKYLLFGPGRHRRVRHLIIDEMQDYTYLQYLIISRLFNCRMTIVGDRCQTMGAGQRDVTQFLPKILGKDIKVLSINKSYRNPAAVARYAQNLLHETDVEIFGREGFEPQFQTVNNIDDGIQLILDHLHVEGFEAAEGRKVPYETCGVICVTEEEAKKVYDLLEQALQKKGMDARNILSHLTKNSDLFRPGIAVTTFYMAKGLEFDQVFCWNPEHFQKGQQVSPEQQGLLLQAEYIAATRTLHEFYRISVG